MRKWRLRKVEQFAEGHLARIKESRYGNLFTGLIFVEVLQCARHRVDKNNKKTRSLTAGNSRSGYPQSWNVFPQHHPIRADAA